jgi:zinc/manganese transport system substrate-binding protein
LITVVYFRDEQQKDPVLLAKSHFEEISMFYLRAATHIRAILCMILVVSFGLAACGTTSSSTGGSGSAVLHVVAGQNFWGSIAAQLGGTHVVVTSIVNDPNADPHQYESDATAARTFAAAKYVVLNGAGYDNWGQKLLDANPATGRKVFTVASLLGKKEGDNPHFWYDPAAVERVANQITADYTALDAADAAYFAQQRTAFETALKPYHDRLDAIKAKFAGQKVGATESIFVYLATYLGLNLISPPAFMQAVAEGNDPPADSVATFQQQIKQKQIRMLVYNTQTITDVTDNLKQLAAQQKIPLVPISETIQPANTSFEDWQTAQLTVLENGLNAQA